MNNSLQNRLSSLWQPPNFIAFFEKSFKRPPHLIKKGTIILNEGDHLDRLYCIKEGFVKLYRLSSEGRETTTYLFGPGNVLGLRALTSRGGCTKHTVEALTNVKILTMPKQEYFDSLVKHPELLVDITHMALQRLDYAEKKLEGFIIADTTSRVANFLFDCMYRFCQPLPKDGTKTKITLPLALTHQRIAEFVGAFRETVTLTMKRFQAEKVLTIERSKITIINLQKLKEHALL